MWITVMNCNMAELGKLTWGEAYDTMIDPINQKKYQLRLVDGDGNDVPEFPAPAELSDIPTYTGTMIIKNSWNTESAAQEFVDFVSNISEHITIAKEQVV